MAIIAKNIIVGKEEPKKAPPPINSLQELKQKVVRQIPVKEPEETKSHYEIIKDGDLVKQHNTKSHYLNDMTGFEF